MIDSTEQERLLLSFIVQNYYKTKSSQSHSSQACAALRLYIENNSTEGKVIDK